MFGCCLLALALLLFAEATGRETLRRIAKPAASLAFVLVGLRAGVVGWVAVGLVAGAIGDVLLLGGARRALVLGIGAFVLNHVAYTMAFVDDGVAVGRVALASVPLLALGGLVIWRLRERVDGLLPAVVVYILVISGMVAAAIGTGRLGWMVGATLFFVSDLAVARQRFVARSFVNKAVGLPLYYAAQLIFAQGL